MPSPTSPSPLPPNTPSLFSAFCRDLDETLHYDAELRSSMHLMSLSVHSNAHVPPSAITSFTSISDDYSRVLVLEQVAALFDQYDHDLRRQEQERVGEWPSARHCPVSSFSLPDAALDQFVLDDVIVDEPQAPVTTAIPERVPSPGEGENVRPGESKSTATANAPVFMTASDKIRLDQGRSSDPIGRARPSGPGLKRPRPIPASGTGPVSSSAPRKFGTRPSTSTDKPDDFQIPPELEHLNVPANLIQNIIYEIMDKKPGVHWDDIAGLEFAKKCVREIVVWPMLRPDLFRGLRGPPKGLLLFGPPGTGKTMIGRAIASECGATFFSISASSLTSKWHGESEKLVRTLFAVARCYQPAVIFVDEIDSLLSQRTDSEFEGSRRLKTEFLVQLDGAGTDRTDRVLLIGATNRPQELDEAARRRLVKRLFIPLPNAEARRLLIRHLLRDESHELTDPGDPRMDELVSATRGYSGADIAALCTEASYGPIRDLADIAAVQSDQVRPISFDDFRAAVGVVRASVSPDDLSQYHAWNAQFGSFPIDPVQT